MKPEPIPKIEQMARCMAGVAWNDLDDENRRFWLQRARAGLSAIRYADDGMAAYAKHRNPDVSLSLAKSVWLCMVDEALTK